MSLGELGADYASRGYALLPGLLPREVATGVLARMDAEFKSQGHSIARQIQPNALLPNPASEIYGYQYSPLMYLHWGMTRTMEEIVGAPILPSYAYFRIYRKGDTCRVHGDRFACEHSISLTLAYAEDKPWALEVSPVRTDKPYQRADAAFRPEEAAEAVAMQAGDGVLYQGVHHHHARTTPNPNTWSAHLFLHWVSRDGPYAEHAFDGQKLPSRVEI